MPILNLRYGIIGHPRSGSNSLTLPSSSLFNIKSLSIIGFVKPGPKRIPLSRSLYISSEKSPTQSFIIKRCYSNEYLEHPRDRDKRVLECENDAPPLHMASPDVPSPQVEKLVNEVLALSFIEAAQFSKALSKRLGVSPAFGSLTGAQPQFTPAAPSPAPEAPKAEEPKKSVVDVKLVKFPDTAKFKVLKEIRNLKPGMNLMTSKALIEGLPKVVMENLPLSEGEEWKKALIDAGAEVELV